MAERRRDKAELGCGTLILIALIVLIFSGGGLTGDLKKQVTTLQEEVLVLEQKIDVLTQAIEATHQPVTADIAPAEEQPAAADAQKSTSGP
jgi:hypothetical protein